MSGDAIEIARVRRDLRSGYGLSIRLRSHMSRSEMARELGVDDATVWRWETGKRSPRSEHARKYAVLLRDLEHEILRDAEVAAR